MELKDKIRELIIENERKELNGLKEMFKTHSKAADLDEDTSLSSEDFAQQDQFRESAKGLEVRITQAKTALDNFLNLDHSPKGKVEPGAMVLTDSLNFYIGISATMFEYDGKKFIGLEPDAPFYAALRDAKKGDEVSYNQHQYKILEIL